MNLDPSDFPRVAGAARLSKPAFDILLAAAGARQAALPTVRLLRAQAQHRGQVERRDARRRIFCGSRSPLEQKGVRAVRFFDLSDKAHGSPETMNAPFTRGFQAMLNPSGLDRNASDTPPTDADNME
ncbi:hypothetical protein [Sphingopyxis sp. LK2115]|jgi:hypothetical protein|uniref:hypothetical protein n=1 Tax=Sphingopyxis sp. LK2115 TaxID=2744558 RepID=UPI0016604D1C|nr:hypothetical protein [Sphingopyxis sp. LK2115]